MQTVLLVLLKSVAVLMFALGALVMVLAGLAMVHLVRKIHQVHGILGLPRPQIEQIFQPMRLRGLGIPQLISMNELAAYAHYLESIAHQILDETMEKPSVVIKLGPIISEIGLGHAAAFSHDLQIKLGENFVLVWDWHSADAKLTAWPGGRKGNFIHPQDHTTH